MVRNPTDLPRVILKFKDDTNLPYADDIGDEVERRGLGQWKQLETQFPGIRFLRLFREIEPEKINALHDRARVMDHGYEHRNLLTYFVVEFPDEVDPAAVLAELKSWPSLETSYVDRVPVPAQCSTAYEGAAGVNVTPARFVSGGDGQGQDLIDLETGWTLNHDALVLHSIPAPIFGVPVAADCSHGTSVLGIVCGNDPGTGFVGIAPNVQTVRVVSCKRDAVSPPAMSTVAEAITHAATQLTTGGVLLIEVQTPDFLPVETDHVCFQAIHTATAAGIVVVEAAGNGSTNIDNIAGIGTVIPPDSGAILVAAASSAAPHTRRPNSNFGRRIDCYAWGDSVFTATSDNASDTTSFSPPCFTDTSAAAAIIAGAALAVQGMAQAALGRRLLPAELRSVLNDRVHGTRAVGIDANLIGVMPNLGFIAQSIRHLITPPRNLHVIT